MIIFGPTAENLSVNSSEALSPLPLLMIVPFEPTLADQSDSILHAYATDDQSTLNRVKELLTEHSEELNSYEPSLVVILTWQSTTYVSE